MAHRPLEREAVTFLRRLPDLLLLVAVAFGFLSFVQWLVG